MGPHGTQSGPPQALACGLVVRLYTTLGDQGQVARVHTWLYQRSHDKYYRYLPQTALLNDYADE